MRIPPKILLVGLLIASCKRPTTTQPPNHDQKATPSAGVGLLDTTQTGVTAVGECGVTYLNLDSLPAYLAAINKADVIKIAGDQPELRLATLSALSSVPRSLLHLFFLNLGGVIEVGDAATLCKDTPLNEEERALLSGATSIPACWRAPTDQQGLKLVVEAKSKTIRGVLLRLFTYMYSEYFVARSQDPAAPAPFNQKKWQELDAGFALTQVKLADAFVEDIAATSPAKAPLLARYKAASTQRFYNMVFANAVDSYYCSQETRNDFANRFKKTFLVFTSDDTLYAPLKILGKN